MKIRTSSYVAVGAAVGLALGAVTYTTVTTSRPAVEQVARTAADQPDADVVLDDAQSAVGTQDADDAATDPADSTADDTTAADDPTPDETTTTTAARPSSTSTKPSARPTSRTTEPASTTTSTSRTTPPSTSSTTRREDDD